MMCLHPEWDVDPKLYEDYDLSRSDVDAEHQYLIPIMEELEQGKQVDMSDVGFNGMGYLQEYYSSKRSNKNPYLVLTFIQRIKIIDHEKRWYGHVILPHIPSAEQREAEARKAEEERNVAKKRKFLTGVMFFRELLRMFFG